MKILVPNPDIRKKSNPVEVENSTQFQNILDSANQMIQLCEEEAGLGLTGVQVGILNTFFVAELQGEWEIVINPEILSYGKNTVIDKEGCLSFPNTPHGKIERARKIKIRYINKDGSIIQRTLKQLDARVFQHEYDHTLGICCVDKFIK